MSEPTICDTQAEQLAFQSLLQLVGPAAFGRTERGREWGEVKGHTGQPFVQLVA